MTTDYSYNNEPHYSVEEMVIVIINITLLIHYTNNLSKISQLQANKWYTFQMCTALTALEMTEIHWRNPSGRSLEYTVNMLWHMDTKPN